MENGKSVPDSYLLGANKCGVDPNDCIIFEDAPSGIRSGCGAGCQTLDVRVITSHTREQMEGVAPTFLANKLTGFVMSIRHSFITSLKDENDSVVAKRVQNGVQLTITMVE
jgi:glycerol-1-phosphatase